MTTIQEGATVKWSLNGVVFTGKVTHLNGVTAQVQAHGATHKIDKTILRAVRACLVCGKVCKRHDKHTKYCSKECYLYTRQRRRCAVCGRPVSSERNEYCSHTCQSIAAHAECDDSVFAAIVEYKQKYDGISPRTKHLIKMAHYGEASIERSLLRLADAGRIRFEGSPPYREIIVVGGKWTYEEP